ncbi:hypothetical protein FBY54_1287 [Zymomonas mobilis]|nr:hypothetical protein FBY55_0042 [Zymomonas mobilis]TQL30422.1 hypothetical protein FBY54_1287 [Zymomonas mobilis]
MSATITLQRKTDFSDYLILSKTRKNNLLISSFRRRFFEKITSEIFLKQGFLSLLRKKAQKKDAIEIAPFLYRKL